MKKFLILSAVVGLAGIGVGIAGHKSDPEPSTTVAASGSETAPTAPTAPAASAPTSSTTVAPKTAGKPTVAKVTTTTRPAVAPTPTTVAIAVTTTTTVVAPQQVTPTCSTSAAPAPAGSYIPSGTGGPWEDVRISSNMPKTRTRLTVKYPGLQQQFWLTTDASGAAKKIFELRDSGTTVLSVDFYDAAENHVGGAPACQGTFISPATSR